MTADQLRAMTADEIHAAVIAERTAKGLKLHVRTPEGGETVLYPKNHATRAKWARQARAKGYTVLQENEACEY